MELLKMFKDYERNNNTVEFWEQLGLLAQLDDELKPTIAKEYDREAEITAIVAEQFTKKTKEE